MPSTLRWAVRDVVVPCALYLALFVLLNPHLPAAFSTHYFFGGADGYQNVWNLWWVDKAITEQAAHPWFTAYLHAPYGTTLIGHTLNPFNGLVAIALRPWLTLLEAYNAIVVLSFVTTGLTAYWLCLAMTASRAGSLLGGAIFTFSSFHFMHADAHLQLTAIEWLPLFVLCWIRYCGAPTAARGMAAAITLWLVMLCDFYYFAYCVFAAVFFYAWTAWKGRDAWFLFRRGHLAAVVGFVVPTVATSGVLVAALVYQQAIDPLIGTHAPKDLSMDLLGLFAWGYYWRFRDWVVPVWSSLSPYVTEASVHVGLSVIGLCVYGWRQRARQKVAHLGFWLALAAFFAVMALGPNLHIAGYEVSAGIRMRFMGHDNVNPVALPYAVLWLIFPPWRLAGVPLRMTVMVQLVAAILAAAGWHALLSSTWRWKRAAGALLLAAIAFEYLPAPQRLTNPTVPGYVTALAALPPGPVLDLASNAPQALHYQTVHQHPIAFGYIARTPASVDVRDRELAGLIARGDWDAIAREHHFRYVVKGARSADVMIRGISDIDLPEIDPARRVYSQNGISIYEF